MMMNKMEKVKILGMSSEEYPEGRIDSFTFPLVTGISDKSIIPLFRYLRFTEDSLEDLDLDFENMSSGTYFFIYGNPKIKAHIIIENKKISIKLDTSLPKKNIVSAMEKYFQFPK